LSISSDAVEALETYCHRTTQSIRAEREQMSFMVAMLAATVADLTEETDASVNHLQAIEKELGLASGLNEVCEVRSDLEKCLRALRETIALQRRGSNAATQRLQDHIQNV
jgi:predicted  nucleic acid-binding Zn-ribbon protein